MKNIIMGTFGTRQSAQAIIEHLHTHLEIPKDDISYVYRTIDGDLTEVTDDEVTIKSQPPSDTATGAVLGGSIGALAGIATVAGVIPVIGPILAAGPIVALLGIGGALGTTAAGALTGAIAGGLIGALVDLGVSQSEAEAYEGRIREGDVLVVVHAENGEQVSAAFDTHGAQSVHVIAPSV